MTLVETMRANRKGIPKELVEIQNRDDKDIKFAYANEDDDIVCSKEKIRQEKYFTIEHNA